MDLHGTAVSVTLRPPETEPDTLLLEHNERGANSGNLWHVVQLTPSLSFLLLLLLLLLVLYLFLFFLLG